MIFFKDLIMNVKKGQKKGLFAFSANIYTIYGMLFGFMFPVVSTYINAFIEFNDISFNSLLQVQKTDPLLWVIDSAPFILGLFARFAGLRQDKLNNALEVLQDANTKITREIEKSKKIENELRYKNTIIEEDLEAAKAFQESFLPGIPNFSHLNIYYRYVPIAAVGGDFLSITPYDTKSLGLFLGDVSGHGVSAALISSAALVLIHRLQKKHAYAPDQFLDELNDELLKFIPENKYITAICGFFIKQHDNILFSYSRGGHPYPIIWKKSEQKVSIIKSPGAIVGAIPEAEFSRHSAILERGDRIFFYTDGILEAINREDEELGFDGLVNILEAANNQNYPLKDTMDMILLEFDEFRKNGGAEKDDKVFIGVEALLD